MRSRTELYRERPEGALRKVPLLRLVGYMCVKRSDEVWKYSRHGGSPLLVLLALADFTNSETGRAFPSIETLAGKVRMRKRNTQIIIRKLEKSGELRVLRGAGPGRCNVYMVQSFHDASQSTEERKPEHVEGATVVAPNPLETIRESLPEPRQCQCGRTWEDCWKTILQELSADMNIQSFQTWWLPTRLIKHNDVRWVVQVPNQFFVDWLSDHVGDILPLVQIEHPGTAEIEFIPSPEGRHRG